MNGGARPATLSSAGRPLPGALPRMRRMTHDFDAAIRLAPLGGHRFAGATHPAYANMVGPFGGVTAAVLLNAALQHPERLGDPIALTVNFAAPLADGDFEITAQPARTNRSTQHWGLTLTQGGAVAITGSAVFAARRQTWSAQELAFPAAVPRAGELQRAPTRGLPAWTNRFDMRFAPGEEPRFVGGGERDSSLSRMWVRDEPPRPLDFASLASLCDSFYPRLFLRRGRPVPIGTVTLSTFFHADAAQLQAQLDRHVLGAARGLNFRHGYFDQSAEVWSDGGELLASSHQMVYYRE